MTSAPGGPGSPASSLEDHRTHRVMVPCPTHTHGHPTIILTQLQPFAHDRHQNQLPNNNNQANAVDASTSRRAQRQQRPAGAFDRELDNNLWKLVPKSMRLQPSKSPSPPPQPALVRRPSISDTIDNSGTRVLLPGEAQRFGSVEQARGSPSSSDATLSPMSPSRKRRNSSQSTSKNNKKTICSQPSSRESSTSPEDISRMRMDDGNPFKVSTHFGSNLQEGSGSSSSRPLDQLQRSSIIYRSQQHTSYSRREQPSTPPTLRHRGRSLGPESPGGSPTRIDMRSWPIHAESEVLRKIEDEIMQGDVTPTRRRSPEGRKMALVRTDGPHFTTAGQMSDSQATQTPQNPRRHFNPDVVPSTVERTDVDMGQEPGITLEDAKTPTRMNGRRLSISSASTKSLHNESPISVRTISRRHSIAEVESPNFKTPTRARRKSSFGRFLRDDGSLSSGRISLLPEGSPMGIDWSQSLETPAKRREAEGIAKTPITNVIQRLRGLPTTPISKGGEEQSPVVEFTDWNPSLETPPRKVSLTDKHDISDSKISAKVLDELRGIPSSSRTAPPQLADKQQNMSSQEGSFYSAASSIISDDDGDYQNAAGAGPAGTGTASGGVGADQQRAHDGGNEGTKASESYPADSEISQLVSSDRDDPTAGITLTPNERIGSPRAVSVQDPEETSPIIYSPMQSPVFPESQEAMFEGVTSAEINQALMSRSTQGSHHMTQPEGNHGNSDAAAGRGYRERDGVAVHALASDVMGLAGRSRSRNTAGDGIHIDPRLRDRAVGEEQGGEHIQDFPELDSDDDFGNIRFSQLDDGFNVVPEATQKPRKRTSISSMSKRTPRIADDMDWVGRSSDLSGNLFDDDDFGTTSHQEPRLQDLRQPILGGGFSSAGGKKLAPISKAALARAASLFDNDGDASDTHSGPEGDVPEQVSTHLGGFGGFAGFGGFSSAGKKPLPQISDAAMERAMRMMQDSDMDVDLSGIKGGTSLTATLSAPGHSGSRPAQLGEGGFSSAGGKALAPVSERALEKWSKELMENEPDAGEVQENAPVAPKLSSGVSSLGGFSTGTGKKLAPASKAVIDKWAKELMEDEPVAGGLLGQPSIDPKLLGGMPSQGGFSTGTGKKLAPASKAALEKWSKEFMDDEDSNSGHGDLPIASSDGPSLSGFLSGSGKAVAPISSAVLDKWSKELSKDLDKFGSRRASEPGRPQRPLITVPEVGFASSSGNKLAPVSKEAQALAYGLLEMEPPAATLELDLAKPSSAHSRLSLPTSIPGSGLPTTSRPTAIPPQPPISMHMQNLKMRTLRGSSKGPLSLPGGMKPTFKSGVTPFKSPLHFKSPLRTTARPPLPGSATTPTVTQTTDSSGGPATVAQDSRMPIVVAAQSITPRKSIGKRPTLHPTARVTPTTPIPVHLQSVLAAQPHTAPFCTPIFNLQAKGGRTTLRDTFGTPKRLTTQELVDHGLPGEVLFMTFEQARNYCFDGWGVDDAYQDMLARGAKADLLSRAWLLNHYGQVVWKLACYVRTWPEYFQSTVLEPSTWFCPAKVLDQLSYRYEREVNKAERPALRKIVEGDETAARHMVLVIASISKTDQSLTGGEEQQSSWKILVSDGWYTIPATLDLCLIRAVERGKLKVGSKVHVCRSKLSGAESGVAILELAGAGSESTTVSIILQANSTRLARWDTKLGFQRAPLIWTKRLRSIVPEGGLVPGLDVVVLRKYPVLYLETLEDGITKVKRSEKEESRAMEAHREKTQQQYQDMVRQVEKEFASELDVDGRPSSRAQEAIMMRAQDMQADAMARNVIPFFTIRVGNYRHGDACDDDDVDETGRVQEALITFWHADHSPYQEGHRVRVTSLVSKKLSREHGLEEMIQLTGTRMTTVQEMPIEPDTMLLTSYRPRSVTPCAEVGRLCPGTEIDLVLIILAVGEITTYSNKAYFVVTDASRQLLLVEHQLSSPLTTSAAPNGGEDASRALPSFLKVENRILMANGRFKMQDTKLDLGIVSSLQSYTQITAAYPVSGVGGVVNSAAAAVGWPSYGQSSLQRLNAMVAESKQGSDGGDGQGEREEGFLELMSRATSILTELQH
ncbi:Breast cancer 2, early onset [Mortierella sp. 14UC]|nr:Breast cancer 2, early onset [Mortierella sp. 14UC]